MANFDSYKKRIIKAMKSVNTYSPQLTLQIESLATSCKVLDLCRREIEADTFTLTIMKKTRDGEQEIANPVLGILNRVQSDIARQMRQLKLTVEDVVGQPDVQDSADELIEEMNKIK